MEKRMEIEWKMVLHREIGVFTPVVNNGISPGASSFPCKLSLRAFDVDVWNNHLTPHLGPCYTHDTYCLLAFKSGKV